MTPSLRMRAALPLLAALAFAAGCGNAGADRTVGITATGVVAGTLFFDANGSGVQDAGDLAAAGVRVVVVTPVRGDTVQDATSGADGTFTLDGIPVGSYRVAIDPASVGDSVEVVGFAAVTVDLLPNDTVSVQARLAYPTLTTAQARTATIGARVFVTGVALHTLAAFSDTTLHVADTAGFLRATRVRPAVIVTGDSVRLRGRVAIRDGQRVLDDVTTFVVGGALPPTAPAITTANAAAALGGTLDAAVVRLLDAEVMDTVTVAGHLRVTMNDGSGDVLVFLDRQADVSFRPPFVPGAWTAGERYDVTGVLVPLNATTWMLRPRNAFDLTPR